MFCFRQTSPLPSVAAGDRVAYAVGEEGVVIERPGVQYAVSDGLNIAYTRFGHGEEIVVYMPPWVSNVELFWDVAELARAYERAGGYHQIITIDTRGVGLSDRTNVAPTLEDRITDVLAVMAAEGIDHAHMVGFSEAAAIAIAMASRHPERVDSLILHGSGLPGVPARDILAHREPDDAPISGLARIYEVVDTWGTDECPFVEYFMPSALGEERIRVWQRRFERQSASPGALGAHLRSALDADITGDLDRVVCPVFICHSRGDRIVPVATSRYLAARYPAATVRIWDAEDHVFQFSPNWADIQADMIEWITGSRPEAVGRGRFAAVLFTDIVESTSAARTHGDDHWAQLIATHDATADRVIEEYGGRRVKSMGDGLLAVFDDPADGVACAQRLIDQLGELGLAVRAGLHAGQVRHQDDGDISGTAVNIAARLEPLAEPGQICVSRTITDLLLGENLRFVPLGQRDLKGITQAIEVFAVA